MHANAERRYRRKCIADFYNDFSCELHNHFDRIKLSTYISAILNASLRPIGCNMTTELVVHRCIDDVVGRSNCKTIPSTRWSIYECVSFVFRIDYSHPVPISQHAINALTKRVWYECSVTVALCHAKHFIWLMWMIKCLIIGLEAQAGSASEYSLRNGLSRITHRDDWWLYGNWTALWPPKLFSEWHKSTTHSPGI